MSDTTFQHSIPRPSGPTKRPSLPRMSNPSNDAMGQNRRVGKNTSNASIPTTSPHATPEKDVKSPKSDKEWKKHKETPSGSNIYPDSKAELNNLDESNTSTAGPHSHQSISDTDTTDSPISDRSRDTREYSRECSEPNNSYDSNIQKKSGPSYGIILISLGLILLLIVGTLLCKDFFVSNKPEKRSEADQIAAENRLRQEIQVLKGHFPSQDSSTWGSFGTGIRDVLTEEHRPAIFLLIASHDETIECLAKRVAELASFTLGGTGNVILTPDKFENDKSKVFDLMEDRIRQTKAMVVSDLLSLQPEAIRAFHDICDEYTPLIAEAVYLLTIRSRISVESGDLKNFVDEQIMQKFDNVIKENTLKALVTRITAGEVLVIKEEEKTPCSE